MPLSHVGSSRPRRSGSHHTTASSASGERASGNTTPPSGAASSRGAPLPAAANQRPTAQVATERRDAESRVMRGPLVSWSYRYDVKSIATERWPTVGLATGAGAAGRLAGSSQAARGVGPAVGRDVVVGW